jgi:excisionase family DNA binding protein
MTNHAWKPAETSAAEPPTVGPTSSSLPSVLTVPETAKLLRTSTFAVYEAVKRNEIPGLIRVGRCIRFSSDVLLRWARVSAGSALEVLKNERTTAEVD